MRAELLTSLMVALCGGPDYVEDQFEIPTGFRIYKAARGELTGGSYDITVDGEGRLLVGDGSQVRRLIDDDRDGVYDRFEVIARGLGGRGPQGLLVFGDRLYAVGGDGIQLFEGYRSGGELVHKGRIGEPFHTGGDHAAHTIFRGHDDYLYFITGDGGGTRDRRHITEESSPCLFERACSVFRIHPDGRKWECVGSGGRNAPNVGMNYLGDLFSLDSDMEWHVDLPWWRPVRLHHWIQGGDQGWQGVGAYPPYYLDCLPGIYDVGRGSPDWGVFYKHHQLPAKYRDAYLVCDYLSKSATSGGYATSGRLFAFFLERHGAGWKADMEVLARPKPGARDTTGRPIHFALVDIEVAPDGSLLLSDHNQGVWRIFHDPHGELSREGAPPMFPPWPQVPTREEDLLDQLLTLPQPAAEWSRLRALKLASKTGGRGAIAVATDPNQDLRRRLRAIRVLAPAFEEILLTDLETLAADRSAEIRGQAAWLLGLRGGPEEATFLATRLLADPDPFVRRRTAEALARSRVPRSQLPRLVERLDDAERLVRYAAMIALSHHDPADWLASAVTGTPPRTRMHALVAADLRRQPVDKSLLVRAIASLLKDSRALETEQDRLDLLRVLGRFRRQLQDDENVRRRVEVYLLADFPEKQQRVRWEKTRLFGEYRLGAAFGKLVGTLETEKDHVTQFHLAQALARIPSGWNADEEERAARWFLATQRGWFTEYDGKGRQFPQFWATVLADFARHHRDALLAHLSEIELAGKLGDVALDTIIASPRSGEALIRLYRARSDDGTRHRLVRTLRFVRSKKVAAFLREEYLRATSPHTRGTILSSLARQEREPESRPLLEEGLVHPDVDVARACAAALVDYGLQADEHLGRVLVSRMDERRDLFRAMEKLLVTSSSKRRPGYNPDADLHRAPGGEEWKAGVEFWKEWYVASFEKEFVRSQGSSVKEKSDEEVLKLLLGAAATGGDPTRGLVVYQAVRCATCHGGSATAEKAQVFGPDLSGVTQRLNPRELAESLVYPSKQVAERFKAVVVQRKRGLPLTGFITDEGDESIALVDQERVHRIPRRDIVFTAPQDTSLMPERLLNRLPEDDIRDLMAYLRKVGAVETVETKKKVKADR